MCYYKPFCRAIYPAIAAPSSRKPRSRRLPCVPTSLSVEEILIPVPAEDAHLDAFTCCPSSFHAVHGFTRLVQGFNGDLGNAISHTSGVDATSQWAQPKFIAVRRDEGPTYPVVAICQCLHRRISGPFAAHNIWPEYVNNVAVRVRVRRYVAILL